MRLINADEVKAIICKYENRQIQKQIIWEIEKLVGCLATEEQIAEILSNEDLEIN